MEVSLPEDVGERLIQWFGTTLVGVAKDLEALNNLLDEINKEVDINLSLRYLGGMHVLITFEVKGGVYRRKCLTFHTLFSHSL
ncbi:hypothetical protein L1987_59681 [Smallanthus sonchifolius]|uniref:Uncharacterized protein n=1 Tax=Smallanthus sonchifolius TaxID=185202 RepID=A0ACB9D6T1_9ASTR|nr:hypothetical protein L1987_59681 [Smallanthus sonchifolius]